MGRKMEHSFDTQWNSLNKQAPSVNSYALKFSFLPCPASHPSPFTFLID